MLALRSSVAIFRRRSERRRCGAAYIAESAAPRMRGCLSRPALPGSDGLRENVHDERPRRPRRTPDFDLAAERLHPEWIAEGLLAKPRARERLRVALALAVEPSKPSELSSTTVRAPCGSAYG
jgi:hypothetical protein